MQCLNSSAFPYTLSAGDWRG